MWPGGVAYCGQELLSVHCETVGSPLSTCRFMNDSESWMELSDLYIQQNE